MNRCTKFYSKSQMGYYCPSPLSYKPWIKHYFHSVYSSHTLGVAVLICKDLKIDTEKSLLYQDGLYIP